MDVEGHSRSPKTIRLNMDRKAFERAGKKDDWREIEVTFNWSDGSTGRYHLEALSLSAKEEPQMQTMQPLSHSYQAHALDPGEKDDEYVVKLPNLNGRSRESLENYFREAVSPAFQQEYDLLDRFPSGQPSVLPILYPGRRKEYESCHPEVTIDGGRFGFAVPVVVRKKVPGLSLKQWTEKCRSSDGGKFNGLPDTEEWFKVALLLFKALLEMHTERATHGFLSPSNIIVHGEESTPDTATFINAAEIHRVVYMSTSVLADVDAKRLPVRRWYDPLENVYRFKSLEGKTVRFELNEGSDYYTATDIFSLGVTLAYLATGEENLISPFDFVAEWPGNPGWQIIHGAEMRRTYHVMKAKLLDALLKSYAKRAGASYDGVDAYEDSVRRAEVILQCVRSRADRRAVSVSHASAVLSLFRPAAAGKSTNGAGGGSAAAAVGGKLVEIALSRKPGQIEALTQQVLLSLAARDLQHRSAAESNVAADIHYFPKAIRSLLYSRVKSLCERFSSLVGEQFFDSDAEGAEGYKSVPSIRVVGSRPTLVDSMLVTLASLEDDAECIALTSSAIWSDENFGPTSRLASMLQLLRIRGVKVTWIVALSAADLLKPHVQRILAFRAYDDLRMSELYRERKDAKQIPADAFFYACLPPADYEKLLREKRTFIGVLAKANAKISGKSKSADAEDEEPYDRPLELHIAPDLSSRGGRLVALTYWVRPIRGRRLVEAFEKYKDMARPCKTFERIV